MARRELVIACALIGAFGGAMFGFVFARNGSGWQHWQWGVVVALTASTAISATLLGVFLARGGDAPAIASGRAAWASFVAGSFNGVLMVFAMAVQRDVSSHENLLGLLFGAAIVGVFCAIPFAPALIVVTATAASSDARARSVAARAQGRSVIRNAMLCLAVAAAFIVPNPRAPLAVHVPAYVMALAIAAAIVLFAIDLAVYRALRLDDGPWEPAPHDISAERTIDYGLGFDLVMRRAHDETYRERVRAIELRRGSVDRARAVVASAMRGHAIAAVVVATAAFVSVSPR